MTYTNDEKVAMLLGTLVERLANFMIVVKSSAEDAESIEALEDVYAAWDSIEKLIGSIQENR